MLPLPTGYHGSLIESWPKQTLMPLSHISFTRVRPRRFGRTIADPLDYFYFSIVSYTSLGHGDVFPSGHLRFITGVEALNGLLLIAWSGSFIYIVMGISGPGSLAPSRAASRRIGSPAEMRL